jgi:hypothetical protein
MICSVCVSRNVSSLRANGSRECAPDDRLREAIQNFRQILGCFVASLLAMTATTHVAACNAGILPYRRFSFGGFFDGGRRGGGAAPRFGDPP